MLTVCYGCGLRLSEVLALRIQDIDSERKLLRIDQGKGARWPLCSLSPTLLAELRAYWRLYPPEDGLFAGRGGEPVSETALQKTFTQAKRAAGVGTPGGSMGCAMPIPLTNLAAGAAGGALATVDGPQQHSHHPALCPLAAERHTQGEGPAGPDCAVGVDHG